MTTFTPARFHGSASSRCSRSPRPLTTSRGCERILKTPIPFSYSSYIKQFIMLFALITPFALTDEFGYGTVIAEMFIFFSTIGLELLAGEVEEPFGRDRNDLPLDDIATGIALDVRAILEKGIGVREGAGASQGEMVTAS